MGVVAAVVLFVVPLPLQLPLDAEATQGEVQVGQSACVRRARVKGHRLHLARLRRTAGCATLEERVLDAAAGLAAGQGRHSGRRVGAGLDRPVGTCRRQHVHRDHDSTAGP